MDPETVAVVVDRDLARRALHGECLDRSQVVIADVTSRPKRDNEILLILLEEDFAPPIDGQAVADAIVRELGITPQVRPIPVDAPIPEGFAHHHFIEIGEDPNFTERKRVVYEIIPPIKFC